eukprot:m.196951 g.196951  ORF g.196951 m.196951 type:complete len:729 (+) comp18340_c0_seq2:183-2369(+)
MEAKYRSALLQQVRLPSNERALPFASLLVCSKIARSLGLFLAVDLLKNGFHVVTFAWLVLAISGLAFALLQRPFSRGTPLHSIQWAKITLHAAVRLAEVLFYFFGLLLCGPVRALLLGEYSETALIGIATLVVKGTQSTEKTRGALICLFGLFVMLMWDSPSAGHAMEHSDQDGTHQDFHTVWHYTNFGWTQFADHSVGMVCLLLASGCNVVACLVGRRVGVEIGGAKRLHALSVFTSVVMLTPVVLAMWALLPVTAAKEPAEEMNTSLLVAHVGGSALFLFVIDYYVEKAAAAKLETHQVLFFATTASFVSAAVLENIWDGRSTLGYSAVFSFLLLVLGSRLLSKGKPPHSAHETLPLHAMRSKQTHSVFSVLRGAFRDIFDSRDSTQIFYFLCLNFAFMLVEFVYGISTNSLGLISDASHMLFDCAALVVALAASLIAHWKPTRTYSFGFERIETLSGFANGVLLVVVALHIAVEGLERLMTPPEVSTDQLMLVSVLGLAVNMVGLCAFSHAHAASHGHSHASHGHSHASHGHSHGHDHGGCDHDNTNMQGVFLHVLADALGSVGVIISSFLIEQFGLMVADPLCSLFISALILISTVPLLRQTAATLLLTTPLSVQEQLPAAMDKIKSLQGVVGVRAPHFWAYTATNTQGSIRVVVASTTHQQWLISQVVPILKSIGVNHVTVQVEAETARLFRRTSSTALHQQKFASPLSSLYDASMLSDVKSL